MTEKNGGNKNCCQGRSVLQAQKSNGGGAWVNVACAPSSNQLRQAERNGAVRKRSTKRCTNGQNFSCNGGKECSKKNGERPLVTFYQQLQ
jgi:hypothetical protein